MRLPWISDELQLKSIEKFHPRKPPLISAKTDRNELRLIYGDWSHDTTKFVFYVSPDFHAEPDKPINIPTCIIDSKLPSMEFEGELSFFVVEGDADKVRTKIRSRKE